MSREQLIHEALNLSRNDRERLAEELLLNLDRVHTSEIEQLWIAEAERRLDEMESGAVSPIHGPAFLQRLRQSRA